MPRRPNLANLRIPLLFASTLLPLPLPGAETPAPAKQETQIWLQDGAVAPDGRRIAFSRYEGVGEYKDERWQVWVADRDGGHARPVLASADYVSFSPDGQRLAAGQVIDGDWELVTVKTDGTDSAVTQHSTTYSPVSDGRFAFSSGGGNIDLWRIGADGSGLERLTTDPAGDRPGASRTAGAWSPREESAGPGALDLASRKRSGSPTALGTTLPLLPPGRPAARERPDRSRVDGRAVSDPRLTAVHALRPGEDLLRPRHAGRPGAVLHHQHETEKTHRQPFAAGRGDGARRPPPGRKRLSYRRAPPQGFLVADDDAHAGRGRRPAAAPRATRSVRPTVGKGRPARNGRRSRCRSRAGSRAGRRRRRGRRPSTVSSIAWAPARSSRWLAQTEGTVTSRWGGAMEVEEARRPARGT